MRIAIVLCAMFVMALVLAGSASAQQSFRADIDALQEVPPNASPGIGLGCFTLDTSAMLHFEITYAGLLAAETGAHIHGPANPGANAGVVFGLPAGALKVGSVGPLNAAQIADISAGLYYVNIHTQAFGGGEIRGQILATPVPCTVSVEDQPWSLIKTLYK